MEAAFTLLNAIALLGWSALSCIMIMIQVPQLSSSTSFLETSHIINLLIGLEIICCIEVGRIAAGQLKGNLILGVVLHAIRLTGIFFVLPGGLSGLFDTASEEGFSSDERSSLNLLLCKSMVVGWGLTEIGRYPMYLFPSSTLARNVRLVLPLFTFPVVAFVEAVGAFRALKDLMPNGLESNDYVKAGLLGMVVAVNSLLGPSMAYPALLKKGLPVLTGKTEKSKNKRQKKD